MANLTLRRGNSDLPVRSSAGWDPFRLMDNLLRWDPFSEMAPTLRQGTQMFIPTFDVRETKDGYVFRADVPGIKESDLEISVNGNQLTVSGRRESEVQEGDVQNYFVSECSYGSFTRSFTLPQGADTDQVKAELKDGVLTLLIPKRPELQPRKISLSANTPGTKT